MSIFWVSLWEEIPAIRWGLKMFQLPLITLAKHVSRRSAVSPRQSWQGHDRELVLNYICYFSHCKAIEFFLAVTPPKEKSNLLTLQTLVMFFILRTMLFESDFPFALPGLQQVWSSLPKSCWRVRHQIICSNWCPWTFGFWVLWPEGQSMRIAIFTMGQTNTSNNPGPVNCWVNDEPTSS